MKASELIKALEEGKDIILDFKYAYPERYEFYELGEFVQTINMSSGRLFRYGWSSAIGTEDEVLTDIIRNPNKYQIVESLSKE